MKMIHPVFDPPLTVEVEESAVKEWAAAGWLTEVSVKEKK